MPTGCAESGLYYVRIKAQIRGNSAGGNNDVIVTFNQWVSPGFFDIEGITDTIPNNTVKTVTLEGYFDLVAGEEVFSGIWRTARRI